MFHCNQQPHLCLCHHHQLKNQKEEQKEETKITNNEKQDQIAKDVVTKSDETSCSTPKMANTSEELEDKGPESRSLENVDQHVYAAKESEENIKNWIWLLRKMNIQWI